MAVKSAKDRLIQYQWLKSKIQMSIIELNQLQELKMTLPGHDIKGVRVQKSRNEYAAFTKLIEKIDGMQRRLEEEIEELLNIKQDVLDMLESGSLKDEEKAVIKLRYLYSKKFREIAKEIFRSESSVRRIHDQALQKLQDNPN